MEDIRHFKWTIFEIGISGAQFSKHIILNFKTNDNSLLSGNVSKRSSVKNCSKYYNKENFFFFFSRLIDVIIIKYINIKVFEFWKKYRTIFAKLRHSIH